MYLTEICLKIKKENIDDKKRKITGVDSMT